MSHVSMGVSPSGQDEEEFLNFHKGGAPYFIRGICNKQGQMQLSVFFYGANVWVNDCPWKIIGSPNEARRNRITKELQDKVGSIGGNYSSYKLYTPPPFGNAGYPHSEYPG